MYLINLWANYLNLIIEITLICLHRNIITLPKKHVMKIAIFAGTVQKSNVSQCDGLIKRYFLAFFGDFKLTLDFNETGRMLHNLRGTPD